jgi:hypothetical protein
LAISRIPYGRPSQLTPRVVIREWRGTCSTKHVLLAALVHEQWPATEVRLWHRPYLVTPTFARQRWGQAVASVVPCDGLVDVHTFATLELAAREVQIDVTFPIQGWDGRTDLQLACGPGTDYPAGAEPFATKNALVERLCDPARREPFIRALAGMNQG